MSVKLDLKGNAVVADSFTGYVSGNITATTVTVGAATIVSGTGAPGALSAPNGSIYLRTDGAAATTLYLRVAGAWTVVTSA